jgi:hypothetical protein
MCPGDTAGAAAVRRMGGTDGIDIGKSSSVKPACPISFQI